VSRATESAEVTGAVCPRPHLVRGLRGPIATLSVKDRDSLIEHSA